MSRRYQREGRSTQEIMFLLPGTEIEILDTSPGAPSGGAWLSSQIRERLVWKSNGKTIVGYEVSAPWKMRGATDIDVADYGKKWRLV